MDFIFTNPRYEELGYISNASVDIDIGAYSVSDNSFEITLSTVDRDSEFKIGSLFCSNNNEYGGMIERIKVDTANNKVSLKGSTFRGLLKKEYIQPPEGQEYMILKGNAKTCIENMIGNKFGGLYVVDDTNVELNYKVRDLNLLQAIEKALKSSNCKLMIKYYDGKIHLIVEPIKDLSNLIQYDNDYKVNMIVETKEPSYNHILALGKGELLNRLRLNLYFHNGVWSETPILDSINNYTYKYENVNLDSLDTLREEAIDKVPKRTDTLSIAFSADDAELFDIVGAKEQITGISFKQPITRKILKGSIDNLKITYKVGD